jgi:hypothetical protein
MSEVTIEYGALRNGRVGYGWLPFRRVNGHVACNTWQSSGASKEDAAIEAKAMAEATAARYIGDTVVRLVDVGEVTL